MTEETPPVEEKPNWEGHQPRECGEHRTVGPHRAWCFDCTMWCYPRMDMACNGCQIPHLTQGVQDAADRYARLAALEIENADLTLRLSYSEEKVNRFMVERDNEVRLRRAAEAALAKLRKERE